jgi:putative tryptophan/tyrosine transport system substrate-binding protein
MKRKITVVALSAMLLALCFSAEAPPTGKVPRIGYLSGSSPSAMSVRIGAFRQGLRELGYLEGKNIFIEWRFGEGRVDRVPALAADLVRLKVDVIVTAGPQITRAAKKATFTIPIVMAFDTDPVANGFIASLARPGGNITGLSTLAPEITGKQLELLKEIVPKLSRVVVLGSSSVRSYEGVSKEMEPAADALKVRLQYLDVLGPEDIETAFREAHKGRAEAVLVLQGFVLSSQSKQIAALAVKGRLPSMYYRRDYVEDGGLMSYGVIQSDLDRRAAVYVDKILKGAKPADLPVEQPTKFEFVINLKTAKQIGLTIPPNVLARADRVIK